jgi:DNA-directed RNA polymerase II subunit RPB11
VLVVPGVLFCGYRVPHPLEPRTQIKIQTDGSLTPVQALQAGCESVISQIGTVRQQLRNELQAKEAQGADLAGAAGGPQLGAGAYGYGDVYGQGDAGGYVDI